MKTYTIDNENGITAHATKQEAGEGESFSNQQELASLVAEWPADRLVEVWNGIPGVTPAKKFKDQKSAVSKIWKAIQSLDGGSPAETPTPAKAKATAAQKPAKKAKDAAKGKPTKAAKSAPKPAKSRKPSPQGSRTARRSPRRQQEGHGPGAAPAKGRRDAGPDHEGDGLAGAFRCAGSSAGRWARKWA